MLDFWIDGQDPGEPTPRPVWIPHLPEATPVRVAEADPGSVPLQFAECDCPDDCPRDHPNE